MSRQRYAQIDSTRTPLETVRRFLPGNYWAIPVETVPVDSEDKVRTIIIIAGEDVAGWTLDDYVLPRLASGGIYPVEVDQPHTLCSRCEVEVRLVSIDADNVATWESVGAGSSYVCQDWTGHDEKGIFAPTHAVAPEHIKDGEHPDGFGWCHLCDNKEYDFTKIDWALLREQKQALLSSQLMTEAQVEGLVALLDSLQDHAFDVLGIDEVFTHEEEED